MVRAIAGAAVLSVLAFGPVHAGPITNTVDPSDVFLAVGSGQTSFNFEHDLGFPIGDILSASIAVRLAELVTTGENNETFGLSIGAQTTPGCAHGNCVPNPGRQEIISLTAAALEDLGTDGKINVTIEALSGGFYFASSQLTVEFSPDIQVLTEPEPRDLQTAAVPVPSTLLLLGAGLMALRSRLRRRAEA